MDSKKKNFRFRFDSSLFGNQNIDPDVFMMDGKKNLKARNDFIGTWSLQDLIVEFMYITYKKSTLTKSQRSLVEFRLKRFCKTNNITLDDFTDIIVELVEERKKEENE